MCFIPQHIGMYDYIYKPFPEIISIIKKEMNWNDGLGAVEHLDCELHDVPFYKDTLRIPNITKYTFHSSGLIRQGLMTREEALLKEEAEINSKRVPPELIKFLNDNNLTMAEYEKAVRHVDKSQYEPKMQKIAREIYHRFRKF